MATIYGDHSEAAAALFGRPDRSVQDYISNSVQRFTTNLGVGPMTDHLRELAARAHQGFIDSTIGHKAQAIQDQLNHIWQKDAIYHLWDLPSYQNAPDAMVPYLMAMPEIRSAYHDGQISGYEDRYVDPQPGVIGERHLEYRQVMTGVVQKDGTCRHYPGGLTHGVDRLTVGERLSVINTARAMTHALETGVEDPTSKWNDILI